MNSELIPSIITISREFGSGGRVIGQMTAQALGLPFYDKEIIFQTAEKTGLSQDFIAKKGEYSPLKNRFAYAFSGRNSSGQSIEDYLYDAQRQVVLDLAAKGPCVIVGRCADYILKDLYSCLNVFIYGEARGKQERIQTLYHLSPEEALRLMKDTDKKRSLNYGYYTDQTWGDRKNYSLSLNSCQLGQERCVALIRLAAGRPL